MISMFKGLTAKLVCCIPTLEELKVPQPLQYSEVHNNLCFYKEYCTSKRITNAQLRGEKALEISWWLGNISHTNGSTQRKLKERHNKSINCSVDRNSARLKLEFLKWDIPHKPLSVPSEV